MENLFCQVHPDIPFFDLKKYHQTKLIASSNNRVYLYKFLNQAVAVKEVILQQLENEQIEKLKKQYQIQKGYSETIIQIYGMAMQQQQRFSGKFQTIVFICMEYMQYCLQDHIELIRMEQLPINKNSLASLLKSTVQTHAYLQSIHLCHGDIKPQNILINDRINPTQFKTCDFDNMIQLVHSKLQPCIFSTKQYHAPEIQQAIKEGLESFNYNPYKAQVYSLGLCLIQMHPQIDFLKINHITFMLIEQVYGSQIQILISKMLDPINYNRPDFFEALSYLNKNSIANISTEQLEYQGNEILKSQNSYFRNTPDMFDTLRRESKYPNQLYDSVDTTSDFLILGQVNLSNEEETTFSDDHITSKVGTRSTQKYFCNSKYITKTNIMIFCSILLLLVLFILLLMYLM
ncbi:unnamed protein product (macronuclear) [Paramecium tetraurelia]|uniref:mitogen-activated protein kinase kinase n=1 Tax=Paramecium tetraurelia TaxID=5888 RepID=A0CVT0_PARTE|nr:uncharacterized protein GSPATT00039058001 [Paramecium tetraurelia]CAK74897.1 unnamed protein product [Paramecium tetraurelia]|eukprot:XP_001442294.1 hypothetical protein (macronuclear) [Paramecium tetraurelia strain d4-2]